MIRRKIELRIEPENMVFGEPTERAKAKGRPSVWLEVAQALRDRPQEWALIAKDYNTSNVSAMRNGRVTAFPLGDFEFRTVGHDRVTARCDEVWARCVVPNWGL